MPLLSGVARGVHRGADRHRCGQGLAFALERPVLPVSNLAALAQGALRERGVQQVAAAIDARMDEVYWGCYQAHDGEMRLVGREAVLPPERVQLPEACTGEWFGAGTGWGYGERLAVPVSASDASSLPNALDILELARFAWARGEAIPAEQAQPVYLRDNVATPRCAEPLVSRRSDVATFVRTVVQLSIGH